MQSIGAGSFRLLCILMYNKFLGWKYYHIFHLLIIFLIDDVLVFAISMLVLLTVVSFNYQDVCGGKSCFWISNYNVSSKNGPEIMYVELDSC